MQDDAKRKHKLGLKVEEATNRFKEEAKQIKDELYRVKNKLVQVFEHKEKTQDQTEYLLDDRGPVGRE